MLKTKKPSSDAFVLKGIFELEAKKNKNIVQKSNEITEFVDSKTAYVFLGKKGQKDSFCKEQVVATIKSIIQKAVRNYQVDVASFVENKDQESFFVSQFVHQEELVNGKVYSVKTSKKTSSVGLSLVNLSKEGQQTFKKAVVHAEAMTFARNLQMMPPNVLNSVQMASEIKKEFSQKHKNISVKVLDKKQINTLKMGLLLSVNKGSSFEPRVVVLEYKGNPASKQKTVLVGKGITFDSGGMNIKTGRFMNNMKFDMSGAAICAGAMKVIAQERPKQNFAAVLPLTDNMPGSSASLPDAVFTSMNGKTVEVNNTDAEGRLILADGLTYAVRKLKATRLVDVATLTGAIVVALGYTYTGVWTTTDAAWEQVQQASNQMFEKTWRMPFDKAFIEYMKKTPVADLRNTDLTGRGGSNSAAMFLKEFTEGVEYIHMDIAGTGEINGIAKAPLVKTLTLLGK